MPTPARAESTNSARTKPANRANGTAMKISKEATRKSTAATPIRKAIGAKSTPKKTPTGLTGLPAKRLINSHSNREKAASHSTISITNLTESGFKSL